MNKVTLMGVLSEALFFFYAGQCSLGRVATGRPVEGFCSTVLQEAGVLLLPSTLYGVENNVFSRRQQEAGGFIGALNIEVG